MQISCAACGVSVAEEDAWFSEAGQVCAQCHSSDEIASAARFQADQARGGGLPDATLRHKQTVVDEQGRVVTRTIRVDIGPLGLIFKLLASLVGLLTGRKSQG